jgi:ATP-dependent DNA helicase RecQ
MEADIQRILENTFGFTQFRGEQADIIEHVINGNDALVIMPTGGGKSLCYQLPALHLDGLTVVVSPLIALMDDQVAALRQLDISAAALHSNVDSDEASNIFADIRSGEIDLLYVSPERLLAGNLLNFLAENTIALFAIDEAHCVSVWGNDFRPEYVNLSLLKQRFPDVPLLALTATADHATRADIVHQLGVPDGRTFLSSFERSNITAHAKPGQKRLEQMVAFIQENQGQPGIVYCLSRKSTEKVAADLSARGLNAEFYHAGVSADDRRRIQTEFQNDTIQIICATIAFGMGIDKPNIGWVIHYNLPKNIEGYYQEIGRAGRDGNPAQALLFYSWRDFLQLQQFIDGSDAQDHFKTLQTAKLNRMWQFATAMNCRTNLVLNYFGEYRNDACSHCDNCLTPPTIFDGTIHAQMALSALVRTKQRIGLNMLIGILRGSKQADIKRAGHHEIPTFGAGHDTPFEHWRHYIHQLLNIGVMRVDFTDSSFLKLTPLSEAVLKGEATVKLAEYVAVEKKAKPLKAAPVADSDVDADLLSALKAWRKEVAQKQRVPAFVIFSDKTLKQIAGTQPKNDSQLLAVDGIGPVKLKKYGATLLRIIENN